MVLSSGPHANVVIHFVCVCVLVATSSVNNLSKCIPFDENGCVLFWALDLEKKAYTYISLFLTVKTVTILTLPLS